LWWQFTEERRGAVVLLAALAEWDPSLCRRAARAYRQATGPRFLLTVVGGDHGSWLRGRGADGRAGRRATTDFWARYLGGDERAAAHLERDTMVHDQIHLRATP
jgi:hypothetical protein